MFTISAAGLRMDELTGAPDSTDVRRPDRFDVSLVAPCSDMVWVWSSSTADKEGSGERVRAGVVSVEWMRFEEDNER